MSCAKSWRKSVILLAFDTLALPSTGNGYTSLCNSAFVRNRLEATEINLTGHLPDINFRNDFRRNKYKQFGASTGILDALE